jgi:hypothetical protein
VPQEPQLSGSTSVLVHAPGAPQQSGFSAGHGESAPQKHALPTQAFPDGAQSASAQQTPERQEPPQQTFPAPHCSSASHGPHRLSGPQIGVGLPHVGQTTDCPQLLVTTPHRPAQVAWGGSGLQQTSGSGQVSQTSPPLQQALPQQTLLGH